jgi:hypothetical protein
MSAIDHLTDAEIEAAGRGVLALWTALEATGVDPRTLPAMTPEMLLALTALVVPRCCWP